MNDTPSNPSARQTGRTTTQMKDAPHRSVFVWCNGRLYYPRQLARSLGRVDLEIVGPSWLAAPDRWQGRNIPAVVLDHAHNLTVAEYEGAKALSARQQARGWEFRW